MDPLRFDRVVQWLATTSRRRLSSVALVSASAFVLGAGAGEGLAKKGKKAKKRKKCKGCSPCQNCVKGKCKPKAEGASCGANGECLANGSCAQKCGGAQGCGSGCICPFDRQYCIKPIADCAAAQGCNITTPCPRGQICVIAECGNRCASLC
jgi:hypothetical protein